MDEDENRRLLVVTDEEAPSDTGRSYLRFGVLPSGPGDKTVARAFNPSGSTKVERIKTLTSALINEIAEANEAERWLEEAHRLVVLRAIGYAEIACMLGVKAWTEYGAGTDEFTKE